MKVININTITYDVIEGDIDYLYNNLNDIKSLNIAFNDGVYTLPITLKRTINTPAYYLSLLGLELINSDKIDDKYLSTNIIDFSNSKNMSNYLSQLEVLNSTKNYDLHLTKSNNSTYIPITEEDTVEKRLLKDAINAKNIDLSLYADIIGKDKFNNIYREVRTSSKISIERLKLLCEALNIKATLILEDTDNAINPMNKTFSGVITKNDLGVL